MWEGPHPPFGYAASPWSANPSWTEILHNCVRGPGRGKAYSGERTKAGYADPITGSCALAQFVKLDVCGRRADANPHTERKLFDFSGRAGFFKLLFNLLRFFLLRTFLDRLRRGLDEILRFLQAETRNSANLFNNIDLFIANRN